MGLTAVLYFKPKVVAMLITQIRKNRTAARKRRTGNNVTVPIAI